MTRSSTLRPRKIPRQTRARATVQGILDATAGLLREVGVDRLTTNQIAERAGINVASLYSYFPNKFAILAALWDRMQEKQRRLLRALEGPASLARAVEAGIDATFEFVVGEPGFVELADAVRLRPELLELSRQAHEDVADLLRELMVKRGEPSMSAREIQTMATVIVEASSSVLAYARRGPPRRRKRVVEQLKAMLTAYLIAARDGA